MLGTNDRWTLWLGAGAVIVGLVGCGGHKSSKKNGATTAPATSGTTGVTSGSTTSPTSSGSISTPGIGGPSITPGGGSNPGNPNDDHGDDAQTATTLGFGAATAGNIEVANDADFFAVDLTGGQDYTFLTQNLGPQMDTALLFMDVNGTSVLAQNDDVTPGNLASRIDVTAPQDGTYYLAVIHIIQGGTGTYEVLADVMGGSGTPGGGTPGGGTPGGGTPGGGTPGGGTPGGTPADDHGNDPMAATAITLANARAGTIEAAADVDAFAVSLSANVAYTFRTQTLGAGMDSVLQLIDTDGQTQIAENDNAAQGGPASEIDYTPSADGTFYLLVKHADMTAAGGTYEINYVLSSATGGGTPNPNDDHGDTQANATMLTLGTPMAGKLEVAGDADTFAVDLMGGQAYTFLTQNLQNGMDSKLFLYEAGATASLMEHDDVNYPTDVSSRIDFTAPADGTYYLVVEYWDNNGTGDYELLADAAAGSGGATPNPNDDHGDDVMAATPLTMGQMTNGTNEVAGDKDVFSIAVTQSSSYVFRTDTQDDTFLRLLDDQGVEIMVNDDEDPTTGLFNSKIDWTATADMTVYLEVTGFQGSLTTYTILALDNPGNPGGGGNPGGTPSAGATLASATLTDVDGSLDASMGDTIVLTFSEDVTLVTIQPNPLPTIYAADHFELTVQGDTFGTDATLVMGPGSTEATITLGQDPVLRLTGTFDPAALQTGSPSGVAVKANTTISTASNAMAPTGYADLDSSLTAGFHAASTLNTGRGLHTATLLDDGRVLVVGGLTDGQTFVGESELLDAGVWTEASDPALGGNPGGYMAALDNQGAPFVIGRFAHTATKLATGEVLIAGGFGYERFDANDQPVFEELSSAFIFDPATHQFTPAATTLNVPRSDHYATLLPNGQVLIAGGYNSAANQGDGATLPVAELFDPFQRSFALLTQAGNDMVAPREAGTADLVNGKVLYVGGHAYAATQSNPQVQLYFGLGTESFDPASGAFAADAPLTEDRRWHTSAVLASGDLLVLGGDAGGTMLASVERYDAQAGAFMASGNLSTPRVRAQTAVVGDQVLVVGGASIDWTASTLSEVPTAELFDPAFNVTETYQLGNGRNSHAVVALPGGKALVVGGFSAGTSLSGMNGAAVPACEVFVRP